MRTIRLLALVAVVSVVFLPLAAQDKTGPQIVATFKGHGDADQQEHPANPVAGLARDDQGSEKRERHRQHDPGRLSVVERVDQGPVDDVQRDDTSGGGDRETAERPDEPSTVLGPHRASDVSQTVT